MGLPHPRRGPPSLEKVSIRPRGGGNLHLPTPALPRGPGGGGNSGGGQDHRSLVARLPAPLARGAHPHVSTLNPCCCRDNLCPSSLGPYGRRVTTDKSTPPSANLSPGAQTVSADASLGGQTAPCLSRGWDGELTGHTCGRGLALWAFPHTLPHPQGSTSRLVLCWRWGVGGRGRPCPQVGQRLACGLGQPRCPGVGCRCGGAVWGPQRVTSQPRRAPIKAANWAGQGCVFN